MGEPPLGPDAESFHRFHKVVLPRRIAAGNGALAHADLHRLGTLAVRTPAGAYTYLPTTAPDGDSDDAAAGTIEVVEGDECADSVVELDLESWLGLISDLDTAPGLFYGGRATVPHGNPMRFVRWEPGLRALFHGLPVFDPDTADLRDLGGEPLDVTRTFAYRELADSPQVAAEARHFLTTAGYVVVKGVFAPEEVARLRAAADAAEAAARPGDEMSWWGRLESGEQVLTRVLNAAAQPGLASLPHDERLHTIVAASPEPLVVKGKGQRDTVTVLWKRKHVAEGLADLPWHRDCGMGGHATNCPMTVMTICLTDGSAGSGELRALPGSHRGSYPFVDGRDVHAPQGVHVDVTAGDVSLHYSDVMHASLPPTDDLLDGGPAPERISVLLGFVRPTYSNHLGRSHYNDVLLGNEDGQVDHLADRLGSAKYTG
jgi:hypothetical protein